MAGSTTHTCQDYNESSVQPSATQQLVHRTSFEGMKHITQINHSHSQPRPYTTHALSSATTHRYSAPSIVQRSFGSHLQYRPSIVADKLHVQDRAVYIASQDEYADCVGGISQPAVISLLLGGNSIAQDGLRRDDAVVVLKSQSCAQLGSGSDRYTSQYNGTRLAWHPARLVRGDADLINLMKRLQ